MDPILIVLLKLI